MKYNKADKTGVSLIRDCYAEQFADPGDIKFNYIVDRDGDCIDEDESPIKLADRLRALAKRLNTIASFLDRK